LRYRKVYKELQRLLPYDFISLPRPENISVKSKQKRKKIKNVYKFVITF